MRNDAENILRRKIVMARAAMLFENTWAALWPMLMVAGTLALLILLGIAGWLNQPLRYAFFAASGIAFLLALRPLFKLSLPSRTQAIHRIELRSGLTHRPATAWTDQLAEPNPDPVSRTIWQVHKQRVKAQLKGLTFGWPHSRLPQLDPYALRNGLIFALIAVGTLTWGQWDKRVAQAVNPAQTLKKTVNLDAWIAPPAYTARPPVLLTGDIARARLDSQSELVVPDGSMLVVRLNGAEAPSLVLSKPLEDGRPGDILSTEPLAQTAGSDVHELRYRLDRPVYATITDNGSDIDGWNIALIPDAPPVVEINGELAITPSGGFAVPWQASDDYGISSIAAEFKLVGEDRLKISQDSLQFDPPASPVDLQKLNPRQADGRAFMDFTAHPWAGMTVEMRLRAKDQAGQPGLSDPVKFTLPERDFRKLLARTIIEQRRSIVRYPGEKDVTLRALAALMSWPEGLIEKSAHYLGMRLAAARLYEAEKPEDLKQVVELMWELAVSIEDGDLSGALKKLEALRKELQKALAEGASSERIAELMQQMRQALNEYLEAMARQMREALKNGEQMPAEQVDPSRMIQSQDLQKMLDMIENLAKSGARDAAQELLAQLENLMKNLRPGITQQSDPGGSSPMQEMLRELGELMRRQQELMDETFRMPDGQSGDMNQQMQPGNRQSNRNARPGDRQDSLADQQGSLQRMLDQLMKQLGQQGMEAPNGLNRSQGAMRDAEGALREGDKSTALGQQGEAMEGLREGAQSMARQLQQQGTGTAGNFGRNGEARGNRDDPLGRPRARSGEDLGPDRNMVPSEAAVERARRILETLRNRANTPSRPRIERDYIDRLLRGLY